MSTGYTAKVNDGTVTTLKDYALICARAFGALIEMRDDNLNVPTPRRLPPRDSYHKGALAEAHAELGRLLALTHDQRAAGAQAANTQNEIDRNEAIAKNIAIGQRYDAMIEKVEAWIDGPPELKDFMLKQLRDSREWDVSNNPGAYIPEPVTRDQWYADALKRTANSIAYHQEHLNEDNAREAERQAWLDRLWESLPETDEDIERRVVMQEGGE